MNFAFVSRLIKDNTLDYCRRIADNILPRKSISDPFPDLYDVAFPMSVVRDYDKGERSSFEDLLSWFENEASVHSPREKRAARICVRGEMGGGKTVFSAALAYGIITRKHKIENISEFIDPDAYEIPLIISFKRLQKNELADMSFEQILYKCAVIRKLRLKPDEFYRFLSGNASSILLFADGMDELGESERRVFLMKLNGFCLKYPEFGVVITSRKYEDPVSVQSLDAFNDDNTVNVCSKAEIRIDNNVWKFPEKKLKALKSEFYKKNLLKKTRNGCLYAAEHSGKR